MLSRLLLQLCGQGHATEELHADRTLQVTLLMSFPNPSLGPLKVKSDMTQNSRDASIAPTSEAVTSAM